MARMLRRIAREVLGTEKARHVWGRVDIVGDIALLKSPTIAGRRDVLTIDEYRTLARALIQRLPYIRSVWLLTSPTRGFKLLREAVHLAGEERTHTIYREHGCEFEVDVLKVFVTPRLNYEHDRVSRLVRDGETVINMFAGAGLFSILIACRREALVYSIDKSEEAYSYMVRNIERNRGRMRGRVVPILGDAAEVIERRLAASADRVLEPYPRLALSYFEHALKSLRSRGIIHLYLHVRYDRRTRPEEVALSDVTKRIGELKNYINKYRIVGVRRVRPVGPRLYQVVVDVEIWKY
jgi:tRNA (guanine37-N1)-methyltransferase